MIPEKTNEHNECKPGDWKFGKCMCVPDFGSYPQVDKTRGHVVWCDRLWGLNISAICHIGKHNDNCRQRGNANADNQLSSVWRVNTPSNMGNSSNLSSPRRLARTRIAPNAPGNALRFIKCFGPDLEHGHPKNIVSTYPPFLQYLPLLCLRSFPCQSLSIAEWLLVELLQRTWAKYDTLATWIEVIVNTQTYIHLRWGWGWLACPQQQTQEYVPMLKCVYVCVAIGSCYSQSADCRKVKNNIRLQATVCNSASLQQGGNQLVQSCTGHWTWAADMGGRLFHIPALKSLWRNGWLVALPPKNLKGDCWISKVVDAKSVCTCKLFWTFDSDSWCQLLFHIQPCVDSQTPRVGCPTFCTFVRSLFKIILFQKELFQCSLSLSRQLSLTGLINASSSQVWMSGWVGMMISFKLEKDIPTATPCGRVQSLF